jgi:hypothetical protein
MNVNKAPTCPTHPRHELHVAYPAGLFGHVPGHWVCSVCHRTLGWASLRPDTFETAPWPQGRRPNPREMTINATDFNWCFPWD